MVGRHLAPAADAFDCLSIAGLTLSPQASGHEQLGACANLSIPAAPCTSIRTPRICEDHAAILKNGWISAASKDVVRPTGLHVHGDVRRPTAARRGRGPFSDPPSASEPPFRRPLKIISDGAANALNTGVSACSAATDIEGAKRH